jgi:hypothetical protein
LRDRLLEQLAVKVESDRHDVTALRSAENAAGAANLKVPHSNAEAGAE